VKINIPNLLLWARAEFPDFFRNADSNETQIMDSLIVAYTAFTLAVKAESMLGSNKTKDIESRCRSLETEYTNLRELLKATNVFSNLSQECKAKIDNELLHISFD